MPKKDHITKLTARQAAIAALNKFDPRDTVIRDVLQKFLSHTSERAFATDLTMGVIRNRELIDKLIAKIAKVRVEHIEKKLPNIIRVGVYELLFTPDRADYAILDAAAEAAKVFGEKKAGFVNAILRSVQRAIVIRSTDLKSADPTKIIPQNTTAGCLFNIPVVSDPKTNPADYLSDVFSLPDWLVAGWIKNFDFDEAKEIAIASNRRPGLYVRPNALKTTPEALLRLFEKNSVDCELIEDYRMIKISNSGPIENLPGFSDGLFMVQDLTASLPVKALNPKPGSKILDLCAAPGGKTVQLAELMKDSGTIIATDIDQGRLKLVEENKSRLGADCIKIINFESVENNFDAVLLDVPCSNTGVLAKRPEVRYRIDQRAINELSKIQKDILARAAGLLAPEGKICYSTCSIERAENQEVVNEFLSAHKNFRLEEQKLTLPSSQKPDCDGGYYAILQKS